VYGRSSREADSRTTRLRFFHHDDSSSSFPPQATPLHVSHTPSCPADTYTRTCTTASRIFNSRWSCNFFSVGLLHPPLSPPSYCFAAEFLSLIIPHPLLRTQPTPPPTSHGDAKRGPGAVDAAQAWGSRYGGKFLFTSSPPCPLLSSSASSPPPSPSLAPPSSSSSRPPSWPWSSTAA